MIKRTDRDKNSSLRILKVLQNKDYLAIDNQNNYAVLSTVDKNKPNNTALLKSRLNTYQHSENNIIAPNEIIQLDSVYYYIVPLGSEEAIWAKNIELNKLNNSNYMLTLFDDAINKILKTLLLWKYKQLREYLNITNFVVMQGSLHFLLLPRGRNSHITLRRSEKQNSKSSERYQQYSGHQYLSNELQIIKEFGNLLQDIFYYTILCNSRQNSTKNFIKELLREMTKKQVTFQYIEIKLEGFKNKKRGTPTKKVGLILNRQLIYSLTPDSKSVESNQSKKKSFISQPFTPTNLVQYSTKKPFTPTHLGQYSIKKRNNTNYFESNPLRAGSKSQKQKTVLTEPDAYKDGSPKENLMELWKKKTFGRGTNKKEEKYKDWLSNYKFQISFKQRLKHQNEIAREKFMSSVQKTKNFQEKIKDETFYNIKLKSKLSRLKAQSRRQNISTTKLQQSLRRSQLETNRPISDVARKLNFSGQVLKLDNIQGLFQEKKEKMIDDLPTVKQAYYSRENYQTSNVETVSKIINQPFAPKTVQSERINQNFYGSSIQQPTPKTNIIQSEVETRGQQFEQLSSSPNEMMKSYLEQQSKIKDNKRKQEKHLDPLNLEEIEEVKIDWKIQKEYPPIATNNFIRTNPPEKANIKKDQSFLKAKPEHFDPVDQSFNEYLMMINIMGNICVKSVKNRGFLSDLDWRKPVYFIYERFCWERKNIVKCLELGACQVFRKNKTIDFQEWQEWLLNARQNKIDEKIKNQNSKIRNDLNKFAIKLLETSKLSKKIESFVKNRDKILEFSDKSTRDQLSKLAIGTVVELYDIIVEKRLTLPEVINFFFDCLFGVRIISELDNLCPEKLKIKVEEYPNYELTNQSIQQMVDQLYEIYFHEQIQKKKK